MTLDDVVVVGNFSDDPFAIDVAFAVGQSEDIADLISIKTFANTEFCPRFISDEQDLSAIGSGLVGKTVIIVSATNRTISRNNLAMRNLLIARAAKDNGAEAVVLVEPDLFYSAQDRGPGMDQGTTEFERDVHDRKKFDGQPFSSRLYAEMLHLAGVDRVVTVHNHSSSVETEFRRVFDGRFHNLVPYEVYLDYLHQSNIVDFGPTVASLALCAPDKGARGFVTEMVDRLENVPIERIGWNLEQSLAQIRDLVAGVNDSYNSGSLGVLVSNLEQASFGFDQLVKDMSDAASAVDHSLAPDSELQYNFNEMLETVTEAADTFDLMLEELNRYPNSLIVGKEKKE